MTDHETLTLTGATLCGLTIGIILTVMAFSWHTLKQDQTVYPDAHLTPAKVGPSQQPKPESI